MQNLLCRSSTGKAFLLKLSSQSSSLQVLLCSSLVQMSSPRERTFIAIKPDGVQRGLVNEIIKRFEQRGFKLVGMKMVKATVEKLEEHYAEHIGKPFLPELINFMSSGPIIAMVWEGTDVIIQGRRMIGATKPLVAEISTIRGQFGIDCRYNLIHGSDGPESAVREIGIWFDPTELCDWEKCTDVWIFE